MNKKSKIGGCLGMLLVTLGASLLGNMLTRKVVNIVGEGISRAGYGSKGSWINKDF